MDKRRTRADNGLSKSLEVSIREFLQTLIDERDRLYDMRFKASETAVNAALAAQEKSVAAAFQASEKAIVKAEDAQKDYNTRSNEFRGQLDDQAKTLMPRLESQTVYRAFEDKLESLKVSLEKSVSTYQKEIGDLRASMQKEITDLRESRSAGAGEKQAIVASRAQHNWGTTLAVTLALAAVTIIMNLIALLYRARL